MLSRFVFFIAEARQKLNQDALLWLLCLITVFVVVISGVLLVSKIDNIKALQRQYMMVEQGNQKIKVSLEREKPFFDTALLNKDQTEKYFTALDELISSWGIQQVPVVSSLVELNSKANRVSHSTNLHTLHLLAPPERMIEFLLFINQTQPKFTINAMCWQASQRYRNKVLLEVAFVFNPTTKLSQ